MNKLFTGFCMLLALTGQAQEGQESGNGKNGIVCKFVQEQRTLVIEPINDGKGCELVYTKYGAKEIPASSQQGHDICHTVQQKIKTKLESVGFDCYPLP